MSLHFRRQERPQLLVASSQVQLLQAGTPSSPCCAERPEAACPGLGPALLSNCGRLPDFSGLGFLAFISTQSRASSPLSAGSLLGRPGPLWVRESLRRSRYVRPRSREEPLLVMGTLARGPR